MMQPVVAILSGFGQWVRNRTVIPLLRQYPDVIKIAVTTSVGKEEFEKLVRPTFEENSWVVPAHTPNFEDACSKTCSEKDNPVAVLVTTPNALHFNEAKMAIKAGCHVYVERPVVTKNDHLPTLIELADKHKVLLFTGTQRRLEDPFQYLLKAVTKRYEFGELKRIRCRFAARHCLKGWRRDPKLSGGGVVADSGYHLLDIAAWLVEAAGTKIPENLKGAVHFSYDEPGPLGTAPLETEAVGYIELPADILLSFDFTYNAPENSIYEQVELYDQDFTRIALTRDQARRTPLPATISHQLPNGQFVRIKTLVDREIRAEAIRFAGAAQNAEPLRLFIEAVKKGYGNVPGGYMLEARNSMSTWHLIQEIYRLASKCKHQ